MITVSVVRLQTHYLVMWDLFNAWKETSEHVVWPKASQSDKLHFGN